MSQAMLSCTSTSCVDLTVPFTQVTLEWLVRDHSVALGVIVAYTAIKLLLRVAGRVVLGTERCSSTADIVANVWDPACLVHNLLSVAAGVHAVLTWEAAAPSDTCNSLSEGHASIMLLQAAHCVSDFIVFLPQMLAEPVFVAHHGVLLAVSLILPHCPGCYFAVAAFAVAELGSASIAIDAEWRRFGGASRGLKRVVIFGGSRVVNLAFLHRIWLVTPSVHEFAVLDGTDGSLVFKANVPICFAASVGGSAMMLGVNGLTWWRMWRAYLKLKKKRLGKKDV